MTQQESTHIKELIYNRKATFQYEIIEKLETGIELKGTEIKSLRAGGGNLQDAFISVEAEQLWLIGSQIAPYSFGSYCNHEERRKRKLLAHKKEIRRLQSMIDEKGFSCIPLSLYLKNGRAKLMVAVAKGKKLYDKRASIKDREDNRSIQRALKENRS